MHKPLTRSLLRSRDERIVYSSAADIADFIANGSPGATAPWNTYPHFAKIIFRRNCWQRSYGGRGKAKERFDSV